MRPLASLIHATSLIALVSLAPAAWAQEASAGYPEVCSSSEMGGMPAHQQADMTTAFQKDAMPAMAEMNKNMMQGMAKEDADVAFVCSMIAHHMGAIDMAKAELKNGDDPWAKEAAQKVIDAQTKEIADMTAWLKTNAK